MSKKSFIIDGHSLAHRCFYAMPPLATKGKPMGAVFGMAKILMKILTEDNPDFLGVAFDHPSPTFRHREFPEYKAQREKTPDDLRPQFDDIKRLLEVMGIPIYEQEGFEADDVLGSLAQDLKKKDYDTYIITGDKDSFQLVDEKVKVRYTQRGITETVDYTPEQIDKRYGLKPDQLIDVKALMGDASDNIPGVPGIGEKTAIQLIKKYGSVEKLLENRKEIKGKRGQAIEENKDLILTNKKLVTIDTEMGLEITSDLQDYSSPSWPELADLFREWQFSSLLNSLPLGEEDQPEKKEVEYQEIKNQEDWNKNKKNFKPLSPLPLAWKLKGPRPLEFRMEILALGGEEGIFVFSGGWLPGEIKQLLSNSQKSKLGHNFKTVYRLLDLKGDLFDTALAVYLQEPGSAPPALSQLVERICGETIEDEDSAEDLARMVYYLPQIQKNLQEDLEENDVLEVLREVEIPLVPILAKMEAIGIKLDLAFLEKLSGELEFRLQEIKEKAFQLASREFNLNSPKQLGEVLFEELKLPVIKRTKTGYGTGADILEKLREQHPIIEYILEHRQLAKLKSTYVDSLPGLVNKKTGRLHTSFHQNVTATGRLSSSEPNLQNIPIRTLEGQKIRRAFIAEEGYLLLAADYSQIELRVLAHMVGEGGLRRAFSEGLDIHTQTASEVFRVDPEEVDAELRRRAKAINFGLAYGMSAYGLSQDLNVSQEEAKEYMERYFERFPGMKEYINKCIAQAKEKGYVETLLKRKRYLPDINHRVPHRRNFAERMAINTPIQGTAADIMKLAMLKVDQELGKWPEVRMLLQVHDELVLEVPGADIEKVGKKIAGAMEEAYPLDVPLEVELKQGPNWMDMEGF